MMVLNLDVSAEMKDMQKLMFFKRNFNFIILLFLIYFISDFKHKFQL